MGVGVPTGWYVQCWSASRALVTPATSTFAISIFWAGPSVSFATRHATLSLPFAVGWSGSSASYSRQPLVTAGPSKPTLSQRAVQASTVWLLYLSVAWLWVVRCT